MKFSKLIIAAFCLSLPFGAMADTSADDAIKYRKNLMQTLKTSVNAMIAVVKGEVDQKDQLPGLAATFAAAANEAVNNGAFKQNTHGQGSEKTTATENVWKNWDDFSNAFTKLDAAAKDIKAAADAGTLTSFDQIKPALGQCGYCHRKADFRVKQ